MHTKYKIHAEFDEFWEREKFVEETGDVVEKGNIKSFYDKVISDLLQEFVGEERKVEYGTSELEQQYEDRGYNSKRRNIIDKIKEMNYD